MLPSAEANAKPLQTGSTSRSGTLEWVRAVRNIPDKRDRDKYSPPTGDDSSNGTTHMYRRSFPSSLPQGIPMAPVREQPDCQSKSEHVQSHHDSNENPQLFENAALNVVVGFVRQLLDSQQSEWAKLLVRIIDYVVPLLCTWLK